MSTHSNWRCPGGRMRTLGAATGIIVATRRRGPAPPRLLGGGACGEGGEGACCRSARGRGPSPVCGLRHRCGCVPTMRGSSSARSAPHLRMLICRSAACQKPPDFCWLSRCISPAGDGVPGEGPGGRLCRNSKRSRSGARPAQPSPRTCRLDAHIGSNAGFDAHGRPVVREGPGESHGRLAVPRSVRPCRHPPAAASRAALAAHACCHAR